MAGDLESVPTCRSSVVGAAGTFFGAKRRSYVWCRVFQVLPWANLYSHCVPGILEPGEVWGGVVGWGWLRLLMMSRLSGLEKP